MASSLAKTKRRIASIQGTEKITKAMGLTATVKTKKFLAMHEQSVAYTQEFLALMSTVFSHDSSSEISHYAEMNEGNLPILYLVISSNMGLCGAYNNNLFRYLDHEIGPNDIVAPLGNKAIHRFSRDTKYAKRMDERYEYVGLNTDMETLHGLCLQLKEDFNAKKYKAIRVIYTHYVNSITFEPMTFQLLPVQIPPKKWTHEEYAPPLFDDRPREMIHHLLPSYLTSLFYDLLVESELSEQASRRTAMDNANDNADELLDKLTIEYNKARQNSITQEITEVVSGANAN